MIKTVTDGNGTTHFFGVYDGKHTIGKAMLFIPFAVALVEQVPMLVYYHGHNGRSSIEGYVTSMVQRDFRPLLKTKKVLLVEPWGEHKSTFHALGRSSGLTTLIDQAMFIAISNGPPARACPVKSPPPPSLILAGFSGGGDALRNVVIGSKATYIKWLTEVWCFDCMYSGEGQAWVNWAKDPANAAKKLRVRLSTGENSGKPRAQGDIIRKAAVPNIDIDKPIDATHEELPGKFIPGWL